MSTTRDAYGELSHATWSLDCAVAGLLFVFTVLPLIVFNLGVHAQAAVLLGTLLCLVVILRRRHPMLTMAMVTVICLVHAALLPYPTPALVAVLLVCYSVARWVPGRRSRVALALTAAGSIIGPGRWLGFLTTGYVHPADFPWVFFLLAALGCGGLGVTCYAIGRRVRESAEANRARVIAEGERRSLELAEREQSARMADVSARSQIARELHDIVAHSLSVMIVQAEGGKALARKKPEQAAEVLDTIAETGREALGEMRRIVDVLRGGPEESADYAPTPGLAEIPDMVQRSGDRVRLYVEGTPPAVQPALGLTAYRVVQEALTNVLKHAGADATATVTLTYSEGLIVVEVSDDGLGQLAQTGDGRGHGLQGMRERVTSMHGQLLAQPRTGSGFLVRAILPVPPMPPTTQETR